MGLRFRRSVRLFPGVRLNFSASGVSTSIGVRGASVTVGARGTYANVGLPGTGLSYRTRLDTVSARPAAPARQAPSAKLRAPIQTSGVAALAGTEVDIKSADVTTLTSPGLDGLKQLIIEATERRADLRGEQVRNKATLAEASRSLAWAELPILRLFTGPSIPKLVEQANQASERLSETQAYLEGCFVEVDFSIDHAAWLSYEELCRAFDQVSLSDGIWDITTIAGVDRVTTRSAASTALNRVPVKFGFEDSDLIRSKFRAMRLQSAEGRDLRLYPGFAMMLGEKQEFALIEHKELDCRIAPLNFIEEDAVPRDAEQIGAVWKKSNKDGSPDKRFNNNYQIPLLKYAGLSFSSPTGIREVYQVSNYAKAYGFAEALANHRRSIIRSAAPTDLTALPTSSDEHEEGVGEAPLPDRAIKAKARKYLAVDAAALIGGLALVISSSLEAAQHWSRWFPPAPPAASPAAAPLAAPSTSTPVLKRHRRRHHRSASTPPAEAAPKAPAEATAPSGSNA